MCKVSHWIPNHVYRMSIEIGVDNSNIDQSKYSRIRVYRLITIYEITYNNKKGP